MINNLGMDISEEDSKLVDTILNDLRIDTTIYFITLQDYIKHIWHILWKTLSIPHNWLMDNFESKNL